MPKRLFLAINLPVDSKESLGIVIKKLSESNIQAEIKRVNASLLRITIHFLGYVGQEKISEICGYLK